MNRVYVALAILLAMLSCACAQSSGEKVSALPPATTPLSGNELLYIIQNGLSNKVPANAFDLSGAAASALAQAQSTSLSKANNLLDLPNLTVARANLGAAGSGVNTDITQLNGTVFSASNNILVAGTNGLGVRDSGLQLLKTYVGTVAPGANQDSTQGYSVGSSGVNTTNGSIYVAQSVNPGAAVWVLSSVPGLQTFISSVNPGVNDDGAHGYSVGSMGINTTSGRTFMLKSNGAGAAVWVANGMPIVFPQTTGFYTARGQAPFSPSSAIGSTTIIALAPFIVGQTMTVNALGTRINTAGSSNIQISIYASSPTTSLPTGAALVTTPNIADTSTGGFTGAVSYQLQPGLYWEGIEANDTTVALMGPGSGMLAEFIGTFGSGAGALSSATSATNCITAPTSAFGTWPDLTAATFTITGGSNTCGILIYRVNSLP